MTALDAKGNLHRGAGVPGAGRFESRSARRGYGAGSALIGSADDRQDLVRGAQHLARTAQQKLEFSAGIAVRANAALITLLGAMKAPGGAQLNFDVAAGRLVPRTIIDADGRTVYRVREGDGIEQAARDLNAALAGSGDDGSEAGIEYDEVEHASISLSHREIESDVAAVVG